MKNKLLIILICIFFAVAVIWGFLRFVIGGPEDTWICVNGEWVKHGNPSAPKPGEPCGKKQETMKIKVYFNNDRMDPEFSCNKVFPVEREIYKTEAVGRAALEELLKGTTDEEEAEGFFTNINPNVKIQSLIIDPSADGGVAKVDFDEQLEFQVGGSCRVAAIRWQIVETLKQFSTVKEVIISINGRTEDILQP